MISQQTLTNYGTSLPNKTGDNDPNGGFLAVTRLDDFSAGNLTASVNDNRNDFYTISLIGGDLTYHHLNKNYRVRPGENVLVFSKRGTPYQWEIHSGTCSGYSCMFTEDFLPFHTYMRPADLSVFNDAFYSLLRIEQKDKNVFEQLFRKMIAEQASAYAHKCQLLFIYVLECIHTAMKLAPEIGKPSPTAATRLANAFKRLLNDQFPIENPFQELSLRSPQAFADKLAVHVNYLNRTLKTVIGRTTTQLVNERIMLEARALLLHSGWSVSQISNSLGFDGPSHFTKAFRKATGETPSVLRRMV